MKSNNLPVKHVGYSTIIVELWISIFYEYNPSKSTSIYDMFIIIDDDLKISKDYELFI